MLNLRKAFFILICLFAFVFALGVYFSFEKSVRTLLFKQYEQKLKSIDDALRFGLLSVLNEANIKDFTKEFRIDLILSKEGQIHSSLSSKALQELFLQQANSQIQSYEVEGKRALFKAYEFGEFSYILIVYPRILSLYGYEFELILISLVCFLLCLVGSSFFARKFQKNLKQSLNFLDKLDEKDGISLEKSFFKELDELNLGLRKVKVELLRKADKAKKQERKIALKNTQLSNVISSISHELKNPLSVIDLSLELLRQKELDEALKKELLAKISSQSKKLNELTNKLNLVFNLKHQALQKKEFDLFLLCQKLVSNPGFERVKFIGNSCKIKADEFLIEQVLINLLGNALKYSQKDILLKIERDKISVCDFGRGIENKEFALITKKFYTTHSQDHNSFGIGLFLVKKILNLHGVKLEIKSELGKGSIFSFSLRHLN